MSKMVLIIIILTIGLAIIGGCDNRQNNYNKEIIYDKNRT